MELCDLHWNNHRIDISYHEYNYELTKELFTRRCTEFDHNFYPKEIN